MSDEKNNIMLESNAKEHKKSPKQEPGLQNDNSNNTKKKFTFSIWYFVIAFINNTNYPVCYSICVTFFKR